MKDRTEEKCVPSSSEEESTSCVRCRRTSPVSALSIESNRTSSSSSSEDDEEVSMKKERGPACAAVRRFRRRKRRRALVCVQAFPPLLKNAGGVAMRYLTLCRALIDELGWDVTLMTPVHVARSQNEDIERWIRDGRLTVVPARGVRVTLKDGIGVFLDVFSIVNTFWFFHLLVQHKSFDVCIADDVPWRLSLIMMMRSFFDIPCIVTTHTDATRLEGYRYAACRLVWRTHMWSARLAHCHATVSNVFGKILASREGAPVQAVWPYILWASEFRSTRLSNREKAIALRREWLERLGFRPKMIFLYVGRWAKEKRIHLLFDAIPEGCALVVCGDSTSPYADKLARGAYGSNEAVLLLRGMLNAREMRSVYAAADMMLSASDFETLGNTVIEAIASGTPAAVHPAQGHLELVRDAKNSFLVDFNDATSARRRLTDVCRRFHRVDTANANEFEMRGDDPCDRRWRSILPDLADTSRRLRTSRFAEGFERDILRPVLHDARHRSRTCRDAVVHHVRRVLYGIAWLLTWIVLRSITRTLCMISTEPKLEVLGELGASVETDKTSVVEEEETTGEISSLQQEAAKGQ